MSKYSLKCYYKHRQKYLENARARYNADQNREKHLRRRYGISQEEYQRLYDEQDGLCAICQNHEEMFHVDHDHDTGLVRGLLCKKCNTAIGLLGESIETLHSAIDYLECHAIDRRMAEFREEMELCPR